MTRKEVKQKNILKLESFENVPQKKTPEIFSSTLSNSEIFIPTYLTPPVTKGHFDLYLLIE